MAYDAGTIDATLTLNRNPFTAGIAAAKTQARGLERQKIKVNVGVELNQRDVQRVKATLRELSKRVVARASVNVDRRAFDKLVVDLKRFARTTYTARARINTSSAEANLRRLDRQINNVRRRLRDLGGDSSRFGNDASNGFGRANSRFERLAALIISAAPVISSALVSIVGVVGALGGAFGVLAAGVGAFALVAVPALQAINEATKTNTKTAAENASAQKALRHAQESVARARETAAQNEVQSARRIGDAQRALLRTREDAAEGAARAARAVQDAERGLITAQRTAKKAQEDLNRARKDAVEELEDLKLALRGGALNEEQAILDLEEAQLKFNEAVASGTSGNELKQLELNVRQASLAVDEAKERFGDLKQESDEWAKTGIEGSKGVQDAQENLADANQGIKDAERDLADARAEQVKQAIDGHRAIEDAERNLFEVQADAAQQRIEDQRAIRDAVEDLRDVQTQQIDEAIQKYNLLSPAMKRAADALKILKDQFKELQKQTEEAVADAFIENFRAAGVLLGTLAPVINATADGFAKIGKLMQQYFGSPEWLKFRDFVAANISPIMEKFFLIIAYGTQGVMNLIMAFKPLTDWMLDALVTGMKDFANWTNSLSDDPAFIQFMDRVKEATPAVLEFLGKFLRFVWDLAIALEPLGTLILKAFNGLFDALHMIPPEWLGAIALGIGAIWAAIALGATGPVGLLIGAIAGVAAGLSSLYSTNESFRGSVDNFVDSLKAGFLPIWTTIADAWEQRVQPALDKLWDAIKNNIGPVLEDLWAQFQEKILPSLQHLADIIFNIVIPAIIDWFTAAQPVFAWFIDIVGTVLITVFQGLIDFIAGAFQIIGGLLSAFTALFSGDWQGFLDGLKVAWQGLWDAIGAILNTAWDLIKLAVKAAGDAIVGLMKTIANIFRDPINWVINFVVNDGILDAWNTVMGWIGAEGLKVGRVPELPAFASGGPVSDKTSGGRVTGRGSETSDDVLARLSKDEFVVRGDIAKKTHRFLAALNAGQAEAIQAAGGPGKLASFAGGGAVGGAVARAQQIASAMSGKPYIWGGAGPGGADCSGYQSIITNALRGEANPYHRVGSTGNFPWPGFVGGLNSAYAIGAFKGNPGHMAGTLAGVNVESGGSHGNVAYGGPAVGADSSQFNIQASLPQVGGAFAPGGGGGGGFAMPDFLGMARDLFGKLLNLDGWPGKTGALMDSAKEVPMALVNKVMEAAIKRIEDWIASFFSFFTGGAGANVTGPVVDQVRAVANAFGWGSGPEWDAISKIVQKESGWNPNAANPTSSARGLFQKMTSIHGPVEGTAGGQAQWGLSYIKSRYGTPSAAWNFHLSHGSYDNGGLLQPGATLAMNATGRPEKVSTYDQWNEVTKGGVSSDEIAGIVRSVIEELGTEGGDTFNVMLPERATVRELADTIRFQKRVNGKGRYSR